MGVTAELQIDLALFGLLQLIGLVVEDDGIGAVGSIPHHLSQCLALGIGAVVAANDGDCTIDNRRAVDEQTDACLTIELTCLGFAAVIFMVTQTGIDRSLDAPHLLRHVLFDERTRADVDDVARDEHHIWLLGVDEVHPTGEFGTTVVEAEVHVAHHHHFIVVGKRF